MEQNSPIEESEKEHIVKALNDTGWRVSGKYGAAEILGINSKTLESRMQKLGIKRDKKNSWYIRTLLIYQNEAPFKCIIPQLLHPLKYHIFQKLREFFLPTQILAQLVLIVLPYLQHIANVEGKLWEQYLLSFLYLYWLELFQPGHTVRTVDTIQVADSERLFWFWLFLYY